MTDIIVRSNPKSFEERIADIRKMRGELTREKYLRMLRYARESAQDCGEIPLLPKPPKQPPRSRRIIYICPEEEICPAPVISFPGNPTVDEIIQFIANKYKLRVADILSHRRILVIKRPRQIAMYLSRTMTHSFFEELGRAFHKDHTSVIYSVNKVAALVATDSALAEEIEELRAGLVG